MRRWSCSSKTGLTVLRLAEVQQPKTVHTLSSVIRRWASRAKVGSSERPSATTGLTGRPTTPPAWFLLEREQDGIDDGRFTVRHGAGQGVKHADLDGLAGERHNG